MVAGSSFLLFQKKLYSRVLFHYSEILIEDSATRRIYLILRPNLKAGLFQLKIFLFATIHLRQSKLALSFVRHVDSKTQMRWVQAPNPEC